MTLYIARYLSHELSTTRQLNMVRGQVREYNRIFLPNFEENEADLLPGLLWFFKKAVYELSVSSLQLSFIIFQ